MQEKKSSAIVVIAGLVLAIAVVVDVPLAFVAAGNYHSLNVLREQLVNYQAQVQKVLPTPTMAVATPSATVVPSPATFKTQNFKSNSVVTPVVTSTQKNK